MILDFWPFLSVKEDSVTSHSGRDEFRGILCRTAEPRDTSTGNHQRFKVSGRERGMRDDNLFVPGDGQ